MTRALEGPTATSPTPVQPQSTAPACGDKSWPKGHAPRVPTPRVSPACRCHMSPTSAKGRRGQPWDHLFSQGSTEQFWTQLRPRFLPKVLSSCKNPLQFRDQERDWWGGDPSVQASSFKPLSLHVFTQGRALKKCEAFEAHHFN